MAKRIVVYGIKNCDTMKKTFTWLDAHAVAYDFHDYKKQGADEGVLKAAISQYGWESVINRKGTTWKKLSEAERENMTQKSAVAAAVKNPSLIKRPLIVAGKTMLLGFDDAAFKSLLRG